MSEKHIVVPEGMLKAAEEGIECGGAPWVNAVLQTALLWQMENMPLPSINDPNYSGPEWTNGWTCAIDAVRRMYRSDPEKPKPVPFSECPIGLFRSQAGTLCLKTEYGMEAYIVESGERFWGGTSREKDLANVMVTPVPMSAIG